MYQVKDKLENHLSRKTNELFDLDDKIILYDLTNTYYEGRMQGSKIAKYGRSKEKRKDAKLVVLAVVINCEGFLKYSNIFSGNMADSKTLKQIVEAISRQTSFQKRRPVVVMDAGIATDENLKMLRRLNYGYMCVSRSNLKEYSADTGKQPVEIHDQRKQPIELMRVSVSDEENLDNYLWVKSKAKALKEKKSANVQHQIRKYQRYISY